MSISTFDEFCALEATSPRASQRDRDGELEFEEPTRPLDQAWFDESEGGRARDVEYILKRPVDVEDFAVLA